MAMVLLNTKTWNANLCAKVAKPSCLFDELYPPFDKESVGYNSLHEHEVMATLAHKFVFQTFIFSNTIAMFSSMFYLSDIKFSLFSLDLSLPFLYIALSMMSVAFMAFMAGLYVVRDNMCN